MRSKNTNLRLEIEPRKIRFCFCPYYTTVGLVEDSGQSATESRLVEAPLGLIIMGIVQGEAVSKGVKSGSANSFQDRRTRVPGTWYQTNSMHPSAAWLGFLSFYGFSSTAVPTFQLDALKRPQAAR